ncbi:hypothetical protein L1887_59437 [Cichorium endivia]|nr:hypothetical protein L1887_59437 [Cichorium endivia]
MDNETLRKRKLRKERVQNLASMIEGAKLATVDPPTVELPSGILAFHIHSITGLEVPGTQKSLGARRSDSRKSRGTARRRPTRAKPRADRQASFRLRMCKSSSTTRPSSAPGPNRSTQGHTSMQAASASSVTGRRHGSISLCATPACARAIRSLAVSGLRLADVLTESSRTTGWYTLTGGLGYGKIRITLLFRSVELSVPRPLRGWNVGIVEVASIKAMGVPQSLLDKKPAHISLETVGGKVSTDDVDAAEDYESGMGEDATVSYAFPLKEPIRLPVRQRYPNSLYISLRTDSRMPGRTHHHAWAFVPLNRISDETRIQRRLRLFETSDWDRVEQDVLRATSDPELLQTEKETPKAKLLPVSAPAPRTLANERLRQSSKASKLTVNTAGSVAPGAEGGEPVRPQTHRRILSNASARGLVTEEPGSLGEDGDGGDGDEDSLYALSLTETELDQLTDEDADSDSPEGRRARARALHRHERGAAQVKGFRTLTWMKTNAEDGMAKMKRQFMASSRNAWARWRLKASRTFKFVDPKPSRSRAAVIAASSLPQNAPAKKGGDDIAAPARPSYFGSITLQEAAAVCVGCWEFFEFLSLIARSREAGDTAQRWRRATGDSSATL